MERRRYLEGVRVSKSRCHDYSLDHAVTTRRALRCGVRMGRGSRCAIRSAERRRDRARHTFSCLPRAALRTDRVMRNAPPLGSRQNRSRFVTGVGSCLSRRVYSCERSGGLPRGLLPQFSCCSFRRTSTPLSTTLLWAAMRGAPFICSSGPRSKSSYCGGRTGSVSGRLPWRVESSQLAIVITGQLHEACQSYHLPSRISRHAPRNPRCSVGNSPQTESPRFGS